jgi:MFS family permease
MELAGAAHSRNSFSTIESPASPGSVFLSIKDFRKEFWVLCFVCVGGYSCILPFTSVFVAIRSDGVSQEVAGRIVSIVFLLCALLTPLIGRMVDIFGRATSVACASTLFITIAHILFPQHDHVLVMTLLGVGYAAFVASIWPLVPLTATENNIGLGYGIMTCLQNAGLTIAPLSVCKRPIHDFHL